MHYDSPLNDVIPEMRASERTNEQYERFFLPNWLTEPQHRTKARIILALLSEQVRCCRGSSSVTKHSRPFQLYSELEKMFTSLHPDYEIEHVALVDLMSVLLPFCLSHALPLSYSAFQLNAHGQLCKTGDGVI